MDFVDILKDKAFVGREFLTWLWFRSDTSGGIVQIPGKRTIELHFLDKMVLDLSGSDSPQTVAITGGQSELREGMAALKEGKKIEEARISIKDAHEDFTVVIKASWLSFRAFGRRPRSLWIPRNLLNPMRCFWKRCICWNASSISLTSCSVSFWT
jgi:hypothetical protein